MAHSWHSKGRLSGANRGYLYEEYLAEFKSISRLPLRKLIISLNRFFARLSSYVSFIDLCACSDLETRADWSSPDDVKHLLDYNPLVGWKMFPGPITIAMRFLGVRPFKSSPWRQQQKHYWIARLVRALYLSFNFHVLVNIYFQYCYDFDQIKLINVNRELQEKRWEQGNTTELELHKDLLTVSLRETKTKLDLIGAPNSNYGITVQCVYLYVIFVGIIVYGMGIIFYSVLAPFDVHACRELLDEQNERHHFDKLIQAQVLKHIESDKMFTETSIRRDYNFVNQAVFDRTGYNHIASSLEQTQQLAAGRASRYAIQMDNYWRRDQQHQHEAASGRELQDNNSRGSMVSVHSKIAKLNRDHIDTCKSLNLMYARGALKLISKAPGYIDRRSLVITAYHACLFGYMIITILFIVFASILQSDPSKHLGLQDILLLISLCGIFTIMGFATNVATTYFFVGSLDQIIVANKIRKLIVRCIRANLQEFILLQQQQQQQQRPASLPTIHDVGCKGINKTYSHKLGLIRGEVELDQKLDRTRSFNPPAVRKSIRATNFGRSCKLSGCDIMNTNLLFVLMQYKIFVAQYLPFKRTVKSFILFATLFCMAIPILLRIHLAYLNALGNQNIKMFAIICSLASLMISNVNIIPLCYLYSRCIDIYRALTSLSAHIARIECHPQGRDLYNKHTVSTLMKELEDPNRLLGQFKAGSLGMTCTYTTLVKTHFWWGLIVLSILADEQFKGQGFIGAMFRDPFGVL